jgi:molecular chaperone GrpE
LSRDLGSSPSDDGFALDVGGDLLAAALAAVEARESASRGRGSAGARAISEDEAEEAFSIAEDSEDDDSIDEDELLLQFEAAGSGGEDLATLLDELRAEVRAAQNEAEATREALAAAEAEASKARAAGSKLLREKRQLEELARQSKDRALRAEERATNDAATLDLSRKALEAAKDQQSRLERDLERAHDRRKRELEEQRRDQSRSALKELLPVVDNLELALSHSDESTQNGALGQGVRMILDQLLRALAKFGGERVAASPGQPFRPEFHEALQRSESTELPEGSIHSVFQSGWTHEGRLLRPARVSVAVRPTPVPLPPETGPESGEPTL